MSWVCVGCSERHPDNIDVLGFGLCKICQDTVRERKAKERAAAIAAKAAKAKKYRKGKR
jgi:hypothetical protein